MYVHVYVYGSLNISVPVSIHAYACVSAYRRVTVTQSSAARPPATSASRSSVFSSRHVLGWAVPAARNPLPAQHVNLAFRTRAPRTTPSMLRLVHVLFLWCVALLVCLLLMLACMCVVLRVACCGVLQRRHNSDAFLKRLGSRHACKLTLNWVGTATRNSLSDDSLCGHLRVP